MISIALATYNGEKYLREQLDSLCHQTLKPDELVVSDDCSTDSTLEIINEYCSLINIKVLAHPANQGVNRNFETAVRACTGDYVMICDQDDVWMDEKVEISYRHMLEMEQTFGAEKPILITCEKHNFSNKKNIKEKPTPCNGTITGFNALFFSHDPHCQGCTMMLNRPLLKVLKVFPNDFRQFTYDGYIAFVANMVGYRCHVKQALMNYRIHGNNVIGGSHQKSTFLRWLNEKAPVFAYQLFDCPSARLGKYEILYPTYSSEIIEENRKETIKRTISYYNSRNIIKKSYIVFSINGIPLKRKIMQFVVLWLTLPLRLFCRQPK